MDRLRSVWWGGEVVKNLFTFYGGIKILLHYRGEGLKFLKVFSKYPPPDPSRYFMTAPLNFRNGLTTSCKNKREIARQFVSE